MDSTCSKQKSPRKTAGMRQEGSGPAGNLYADCLKGGTGATGLVPSKGSTWHESKTYLCIKRSTPSFPSIGINPTVSELRLLRSSRALRIFSRDTADLTSIRRPFSS